MGELDDDAPMPPATTRLSAEDVKTEASKIGLAWSAITGLVVQRFDDGSALVVVPDGTRSASKESAPALPRTAAAPPATTTCSTRWPTGSTPSTRS